jgi:hypothetical protein
MRSALILALLPLPALADAPVVVEAWIDGATVHVTLSHPDSGWEHFADGWEVLDETGDRLGLRVLAHPHEAEQPFTRSLTLEAMPEGPLFIRARCLVDGWNADTAPLRRD